MIDPTIPLDARPAPVQSGTTALSDLLALRNQAQAGELQQAQITGVNQENQQRQISIDQMRKLNAAYAGALNPDGTIDTGKLSSALAANGAGSKIPDVLKGVTEFQQSLANLSKTRTEVQSSQADLLGSFGRTMQTANYDPQLFLMKAQAAINAKAVDPQQIGPQIQQVQQSLMKDPTGTEARVIVKGFSDNAVASSEKWATIQAAQTNANAQMKKADSQQENADRQQQQNDLKNWAARLGSAQSGQEYTTILNQMPHGIAIQFPAATNWTPATSQKALQVGMTPAEIDTQGRLAGANGETARHNQAMESIDQSRAGEQARHDQAEENLGQQRVDNTQTNGANGRFEQGEIDRARKQLDLIHQQRTATGNALNVSNGESYVDPKTGKKADMDDEARAALQQQFNNLTNQGTRIMGKFGGSASNGQIGTDEFTKGKTQQTPSTAPPAAPSALSGAPPATPAATKPAGQPSTPPPDAVAKMPVGKVITFTNGQKWMKGVNGKLTRLDQ